MIVLREEPEGRTISVYDKIRYFKV